MLLPAFLLAALPFFLVVLLELFAGEAAAAARLRFLELEPLKTLGLMRNSLCFGGLPRLLVWCACCVASMGGLVLVWSVSDSSTGASAALAAR